MERRQSPSFKGKGGQRSSRSNAHRASSPRPPPAAQRPVVSRPAQTAGAAAALSGGFAPAPRKPGAATDAVQGQATDTLGSDPKLRQFQDTKAELRELIGDQQFKLLSTQSVKKIIQWKLAAPVPNASNAAASTGEAVTGQAANGLASMSLPSSQQPQLATEVRGGPVSAFIEGAQARLSGAAAKAGETAVPAVSSFTTGALPQAVAQSRAAASQTPREFQLQVNSLSGEVLAVLSNAYESWTRTDIVRGLNRQAPVEPPCFYKITCNDIVLNGSRTLGECGLIPNSVAGAPSVVAVTLLNRESLALQEAMDDIACMTQNDLREVTSMKTPPTGVLLTIQALADLLGIEPARQRLPGGRVIEDYWSCVQRSPFRTKDELVVTLKSYDADKDPAATIAKLAPFIDDLNFTPEAVGDASVCCRNIVIWCHVLHRYCQVIT